MPFDTPHYLKRPRFVCSPNKSGDEVSFYVSMLGKESENKNIYSACVVRLGACLCATKQKHRGCMLIFGEISTKM